MDNTGDCPEPQLLAGEEVFGSLSFDGHPESVYRLVFGVSTALPRVLRERLSVPEDESVEISRVLAEALRVDLVQPQMPLKDAIDLAEFFVDVAVKFSRFSIGPGTVGGDVDIAAISKHEGVKWVKRKDYYDRRLNPPMKEVAD